MKKISKRESVTVPIHLHGGELSKSAKFRLLPLIHSDISNLLQ